MAVEDNTLGAPTEGLGQTVTFAFNSGSAVPQLQLADPGRIRAGVVGGGTAGMGGTMAQGVRIDPQATRTFDALMKVGDAIMRPKLEAKRVEGFVRGMQRAMQGEAVVDIANEQPWYSKLFGDSDVVEGARAYSGQAKAQTAMAALEDNMPELRKLGPEQAQEKFIETVNGHLTGDPATDASVMQAMTRAMPSVMRRQAKEHYGWQQENATVQEAAAFKAGAANLQAAYKGLANGTYNEEDIAAMEKGFNLATVPAVGRDQTSWEASQRENVLGAIRAEQFHAVNALKKTGFLDVFNEKDKAKIETALDKAEKETRSKYLLDWNDRLVEINVAAAAPEAGATPQQLAENIDRLNSAYKQETGATNDIISPEQRAAYLTRSALEIKQARERETNAALTEAKRLGAANGKAAEEAAESLEIQRRAAEGTLGTLATNPGMSNPKINAVVEPMYQRLVKADPDKADQFLIANMRETYTIEPVKRVRTGKVHDVIKVGEMTPAFDEVFNEFARLYDKSVPTANAYYGEYATQMAGYLRDVRNGHDKIGSFRTHFVDGGKRVNLDDKDRKAAVNTINSTFNSIAPAWLGGDRLAPGQDKRLAAMLAGQIKEFSAVNDNVESGTKQALHAAKLSGLEIVGGFAWRNGKEQVSLENYLTHTSVDGSTPLPTDTYGKAFKLAVDEVLYGDGSKNPGLLPDTAEDILVERMPDAAGVPQFYIQSLVDGKPYKATLSANEVIKLAAQRKAREADKSHLKFGPVNRFLPQEGAPSIYGR